ncbi:MAG: HEAT repeat domain-containing protein [Anaerolineae bacterium]
MTAEFLSAFEELKALKGSVGRLLVERFSRVGPEDVALFRERFPLLDDEHRVALIASMAESAEVDYELDYMALLRIALGDPLPAVRRMAIEGLWEDERLDLLRRLIVLLETDPSDEVRAAAATSLGRFVYLAECDDLDTGRGEQVRSALEQAVAGQSLHVARRALESLAFINDETITRMIDEAYASDHPLMRQSALFAMGRSADRFWAETVLAELHSDDPAMRFEAARASGEMHLTRALSLLARLISGDPDAEVQMMAIWAMGEIGGKRARQLLERLAEGEDEAQSAAAEEALERMNLASPEFDMFVFEPEDGASASHGRHAHAEDLIADEEDADEEAGELEDDTLPDYRRQFELYTDEDDDSDDDEEEDEWPDEFFELT